MSRAHTRAAGTGAPVSARSLVKRQALKRKELVVDRLIHRIRTPVTSHRTTLERNTIAQPLSVEHLVHVRRASPPSSEASISGYATGSSHETPSAPPDGARTRGSSPKSPSAVPRGIAHTEEGYLATVERQEIVREVVHTLEDQLRVEQQRRGLGL